MRDSRWFKNLIKNFMRNFSKIGLMRYLIWCANVHINFRGPELKAIASRLKISVNWIENTTGVPYVIVELQKAEDAKKLVSQSMLVRACYELWGEGTSSEELHSNVKQNLPYFKDYISSGKEFKLEVLSFNKKLTREEKHQKIMSFSYMPFQGKVNLTNPEVLVTLIEYYGLCKDIPEKPVKSFFGRWLVDGQRVIANDFSLKKRNFIGNTSMDAELAFLMTNMAQVGEGDIAVDPFVGTGSILVSAAQRGAYVWGWDIDFLMLHGKTKPSRFQEKIRKKDESIRENLVQYGLGSRYLDVLVMDSSKHFWRKTKLIDAIITDPPYGIRESTERIGCPKERKQKLSTENLKKLISEKKLIHYPMKKNYYLADIMVDLLNYAVAHLKVGGRLVFWLPVFREDYSDKLIPTHPCLQLEFNSEQIFSTYSSRRLLTFVKLKEAEDGETAEADELRTYDNFKRKYVEAMQTLQALSKDEKRSLKKKLRMDKRGQGYLPSDSDSDSCDPACDISELRQLSLSSDSNNQSPILNQLIDEEKA